MSRPKLGSTILWGKKKWLPLGGDKRCFGRRLTWCSFWWETLSQRGIGSLPVLLEVGIVQIHAIWSKVGPLAVDTGLVLLVFNVSNQHWEDPGQVTMGNKERSYSEILLHYSSASSSQAEKSTSNHQEKKNRPKCYSWDFNWRARLAWEPYQELGINVICGCVNFFCCNSYHKA